MMKCARFIVVLLAMVNVLSARQPVITPETPVKTKTLQKWLHSGDPRLVAWAADFARRKHNAQVLSEIPAVLANWTTPPYTEDEAKAAQRRAAMAMLDALIQENVKVPGSTISAVAQPLPVEALILIARLPLSESRSTLQSWTWGGTSVSTLGRVALMMLADEPVPELVAGVLSRAEVELQVYVSPSSSGHVGVFGLALSGCGDRFPRELAPGWPQVYSYGITEYGPREIAIGTLDGKPFSGGGVEDGSGQKNPVIVNLDGDRILYHRVEENRLGGTCNRVQGLDSRTRHLLIAHWLGLQPKEMQWYPVERFSIRWTDQQSFEQQLGALVASEREKLQATMQALRQKGLLRDPVVFSPRERPPEPRLVVTITCDVKPCPLNK